ncbi:NAD(P)-dependent oxidoreductase [Confluentibacter flavum]|uniref:6-phosphogluconate dehydrogenase NADP-binding domain-containing protein n=1 Tax=Confluentibacter flavum TaxID=1909700 RepID=A0A2N3HJY3_9FLAO|nr:NAD(P)-binding domain-containing protein [Confluentibacter flavum]PKQ45257.1 hypothetical protein CSW08_08535 [Confluentibacter flavum]
MEKIGFIGLGIMGRPMALHLLKGGHEVTVLQSSAAVNELLCAGAHVVYTPKEVAKDSDVIITCLPDSLEVETIVLGKDGIIEGISEGDLYIDMSTIAPATAIKLDGNFKPGLKIDLHKKDMKIALRTGKENNAPLPGSALVAKQMDFLIERGDGALDHSALSLLLQ